MSYFGPMPNPAPLFTNNLIAWYLHHKRDLPWRKTKDPYKIWLSEIILQQTRVAQGLPYYFKFIEAYPTVEDLAAAPEDEVLKNWQGLGYYSRARNLHASAKMICMERNGTFPPNYKELLKLKGVGDYTASAISSICFNEAQAVVDGNVFRVLSRFFGIFTPINTTTGNKEFKNLAQLLLDKTQPGIFNQAVMEFGARYCIPQNPDCEQCIFKTHCKAYHNNLVDTLPIKLKSKPIKKRFFNYLVVVSEHKRTLIRQRRGKGIWHKLYEFPLIESLEAIDLETLEETSDYKNLTHNLHVSSTSLYNEQPIIHKLSHQHIYTRFWIVETSTKEDGFIPIATLESYAVPVLIENFVAEFFEEY